MQTAQPFDCDVIVAGGGPAGSAASAWLARAGYSVQLFERDTFPRFHIGESLLASVNDALAAIGADGLVREAGFPQKWGATFMLADGRAERYADFGIAPGVPTPQTWQVPRATFDDLLLRHAASSGVQVHERHRILDVDFAKDGVTAAVQPADPGRGSFHVRARAIVDASGRSGLLSRKFDLRVDEPRLANVGIFAHYSGVPRQTGRRAGDIRIVSRADLGWFWLIPISGELMSVGVVLPHAAFQAQATSDHQALLDRAIAETPAVSALLAGARREWPVRLEKEFSFSSRAYAGDRWVLVGDAGAFLDPVFSTGVAIALESGVEGARAISAGLKANDLSVRRFRRFAKRQQQRYLSFRRFVLGFYTAEFRDLFFSEDPPKRIFRSVVSVFAGYWKPPLVTRFWVATFFLLVRLQRHFKFAPSFSSGAEAVRELRTELEIAAFRPSNQRTVGNTGLVARNAPILAPLPAESKYWARPEDRQGVVNGMFERSARHYDRVSEIMAFGAGRRYRRSALTRAGLRAGQTVLDVGTGTGLVAREAAAIVGARGVIGVDPSLQMMTVGRDRTAVRLVRGVGESLPFANSTFDFISMCYALRHVSDLDRLFAEYARVLRPNGRVLLLEITKPASTIGTAVARAYFGTIVPCMARLTTGSADASRLMRFYWDTIAECVGPSVILTALDRAGFTADRTVSAGIFSEYAGTRR
jgi:demethylmenaquinone methyltransferase/2-methoxy-6-polyprenyl-1,4-benzoquinol methylase